jgi:hypothetical protein
LEIVYLQLLDQFEPRRPTESWVRFHIRQAEELGYHVEIHRQGDTSRGSIVVKLQYGELQVKVVTLVRKPDGQLFWIPVHKSEAISEERARRYVERIAAADPDVWILEVTHRQSLLQGSRACHHSSG